MTSLVHAKVTIAFFFFLHIVYFIVIVIVPFIIKLLLKGPKNPKSFIYPFCSTAEIST